MSIKISFPIVFVTLCAFQLYIKHGVWVPANGPQCYKYDWKKIRHLREILTRSEGNLLDNLLENRACKMKKKTTTTQLYKKS